MKLNDWCISRQRKWGTPIPLIYCNDCKFVPVPFEKLPIDLSTTKKDVKCPKCNKNAKLEQDTMDTFVDSSWYYFRYLDVRNENEPFNLDIINNQMPVDIYIGGIEHAMTHLFVSRLITHFLNDQKKINFKEPFQRFLAMGMIKGESFKTKSGRYISPDEIEQTIDGKFFIKNSNEELTKDFEKMSKSKMNGIDPEFMIEKFGIDFTRLFLINFVHPKSDRNFSCKFIKKNYNIFN
jgi:leucyl-tRNA synthetase